MPQFKNVIEILQLLEKSNCRKCNAASCMAFAASVLKGDRQLSDCPQLSSEIVQKYSAPIKTNNALGDDQEKMLQDLKIQISKLDFAETAGRIGGFTEKNKLTLKILGKNFSIDTNGDLHSDIHVNRWITAPILTYILDCKGIPLSSNWVTMRELPSGKDWLRFFNHQCVAQLQEIADNYTNLFKDMVDIFNGEPPGQMYQSDISVVLHPLPLVPILICYWEKEESMDSDLKLFFDSSAEENIGAKELYTLGTGITRMFQKLTLRHGIGSAK